MAIQLITTRCKFRCQSVIQHGSEAEPYFDVTLHVVGDDTPENKSFFKFTPTGCLTFGCLRRDFFSAGKEYFVDICSVDDHVPAEDVEFLAAEETPGT